MWIASAVSNFKFVSSPERLRTQFRWSPPNMVTDKPCCTGHICTRKFGPRGETVQALMGGLTPDLRSALQTDPWRGTRWETVPVLSLHCLRRSVVMLRAGPQRLGETLVFDPYC